MSVYNTNEVHIVEKLTKNPYITIVVPVYNAEEYISQAIVDIQNQTFDDFELFLIDDCSTDGSRAICESYAKTDSRIKVIHFEENGGASKARNEGIRRAKGEYLIFLDCDDRFLPYLLENCVDEIKKNQKKPDVIIFGLCEQHYDKKGKLTRKIQICPPKKIIRNKKELGEVLKYLEETSLYGYPWNKMYKKDILQKNNVNFPIMKFNEDIIFNIDFFYYVDNCILFDIVPYYYIKRVNSSTTSKFIPTYYEDIMVKIDKMYKQFEDFEILTEENKKFIAQRYVRYVFSALERNFDKRSKMNFTDRKNFLKKVFQSERYNLFKEYMSGTGFFRLMAHFLQKKRVKTCLFIGRIIYFVKRLSPGLFARIS